MVPLPQRRLLIIEAVGARHGELGLVGSYVESDGKVKLADLAGWTGTGASGLTWVLHPRTRTYWATPVE